jgi:hypothetical protein
VVAALLVAATAGGCATGSKPMTLKEEEALTEKKCTRCHSLDRVYGLRQDRSRWAVTVDQMIGNGLKVDQREYDGIVDYLSKILPAR